MNPFRRLLWWFEGEVSRVVVEQYEEPIDAIIFPVFSAAFALVFAQAFLETPFHLSVQPVAQLVTFGLIGIVCSKMFVVSVAASVTYYREVTEVGAVVVE